MFSFLTRLAECNSLTVEALGRYFVLDKDPALLSRKRVTLPIGSAVYILNLAEMLCIPPLQLFLETTVYPGTAPLQTPEKQSHVINYAFRKNGFRFPNLIGHPQSDVEDLKFCPVCMQEDIHEYGYSWLRREHHMPRVTACCRHGVKLVTLEHDHLHPSNHFNFPNAKAEPADYIEVEYARFASDFLSAGFDLNRSTSRKLILQNLNKKSSSSIFGHDITSLLNEEPEDFFSEIRKGRRQIDDWKILAGLFAAFGNVSGITDMTDKETSEQFFSCLDGYTLSGKYSGTCVTLQKQNDEMPFVVTPLGFVSGWRSPDEDPDSEQEKFAQLVHIRENGEYEPIDKLDCTADRIRFVHKKCGQIVTASPKDVIEYGLCCSCQEKNIQNLNFTREKVEVNGKFELLSVSKTKVLTIKALDCGHIFNVGYTAWCKLQECRICNLEKSLSSQFRYKAADGNPVYDPGSAFEKEVLALVGDEYEVTGVYKNSNTPVSILHKKCGCIKEFVPVHFLHGARCKCEKSLIPNGDEFVEYVKIRSCGLYEIVGTDFSKRYLVMNTKSGEIKAMCKAYIVQELERPTLSPVLPVESKGEYGDPFARRLYRVIDVISSYYNTGQIFTAKDLRTTGLSERKLIPIIRKLRKEGVIEKVKGTSSDYRYTGGES